MTLFTMKPRGAQPDLECLFRLACDLEDADQTEAARAIYLQILEHGQYGPALINLGSIAYHAGDIAAAGILYERATEADPTPRAFFNLGTALDDLGLVRSAVDAYTRALELSPGDADCHYNLAISLERIGESREALKHWRTYTKLDRGPGAWHAIARQSISRILAADPLRIAGGIEEK